MDTDQPALNFPSSRIMAHIRPDGDLFEWELREYVYDTRRWSVLDSGASRSWAGAVAQLANSLDYLTDGMF